MLYIHRGVVGLRELFGKFYPYEIELVQIDLFEIYWTQLEPFINKLLGISDSIYKNELFILYKLKLQKLSYNKKCYIL